VTRIAAVDVPALPLQLLRRRSGTPASVPLAVVEADHPQARITWVDRAAAARRVRPGMRYASALQLSGDLRAAPVPDAEVSAADDEIAAVLRELTPRVDRRRDGTASEGVYFLDPSGMGGLFGPLEAWAPRVLSAVERRGFTAAVAVGYRRLPTWAVARKRRRGTVVLADPAEELREADGARLRDLALEPELTEALVALGVDTLGHFRALPRGDVSVRFGPEAARLHALFDDALRLPMDAPAPPPPLTVEAELEPPTHDAHRLLFVLKGATDALTKELVARYRTLAVLHLRLSFETAPGQPEDVRTARLEPARPTADARGLLELLRLRLERVLERGHEGVGGVTHLALTAETERLQGTQLALFGRPGRSRDPDAVARGLARLRAAYGEAAVTRAELRDDWLPERRFAWVPASDVTVPAPAAAEAIPQLVRRLDARPLRLPQDADGRPVFDPPLHGMAGPYRLQGRWWQREKARDYFYGEDVAGRMHWLYRDRRSRCWFRCGQVD
jgi:protein ImuB